MRASWDIPYSQIPDKPPRVSVTPHPCRSFLTIVARGDEALEQKPFIEQFNESEELQRDLLGKSRFEAYKFGDLKIDSFPEYEKAVLHTLNELGLGDE